VPGEEKEKDLEGKRFWRKVRDVLNFIDAVVNVEWRAGWVVYVYVV